MILGYYLHIKREFGEWEKHKMSADGSVIGNGSPPVNQNTSVASHTLRGLLCGTKYQVHVAGFNALGVGQPTTTLQARTKGAGK